MNRFCCLLLLTVIVGFGGCRGQSAEENEGPPRKPKATAGNGKAQDDVPRRLGVQREPFGTAHDGTPVERFLLTNDKGMLVSVITYGAVVTAVRVPDRQGEAANVTLGFDTLQGYTDSVNRDPYFGAICGRFANRIAGGRFRIGETEYTLATNNGPNHLHGGERGFNDVVWHGEEIDDGEENAAAVKLVYVSSDGEEGYPGEVQTTVVYRLTNSNELRIEYTATTDQPTPINLTSHCYWNLSGADDPASTGDVLDHVLMLDCDRYLPVDETLIPTGELKPVEETAMDFTTPMAIGSRFQQVKGDDPTGGYDHCYVVNDWDGQLRLAARLSHAETGRVMEVLTTEPGIQLYTGNFLDGTAAGGGYRQHAGLCLECQHFPDSPNRPEFPDTIYEPGEVYSQTTVYRFSVEP